MIVVVARLNPNTGRVRGASVQMALADYVFDAGGVMIKTREPLAPGFYTLTRHAFTGDINDAVSVAAFMHGLKR